MPPCQVTTAIVHVTNVRIMGTTAIFTGVDHKHAIRFTGVQGFVRTVLVIFIRVTADNGCNVGTAFEAPVVKSIKHFFGVRKFGLAVCECAIMILQKKCFFKLEKFFLVDTFSSSTEMLISTLLTDCKCRFNKSVFIILGLEIFCKSVIT